MKSTFAANNEDEVGGELAQPVALFEAWTRATAPMEPLRARRTLDRPTTPTRSSDTNPSSTQYPPDPYSAKVPLTNRPRKPSLSDRIGSPGGKRAKRDAPASLWSRVGGGLDVVQPGENRVLAGVILLGSVVRLWKIGRPSSVVFDEVHFGGYIQSRFFMDVHPPLAKLLITLVAFVSGFKGGSFDFKDIGREYGRENVPYIAMRLLPATLGLALIPLAYLTLRALQLRPATALLGSLFIMFENGLITQSRFILLDSPLIFFTALSVFFWVGFSNENDVPRDRGGRVGPFSRRWWIWLTLTGLALGAVVSCKWVGLFTIATVGVYTIVQLWNLLGDLRVPIPLLARHFVARAVCLIAVPIVFYISMFAIHFAVLSNSGEGDGFMSSEFQHTLRGHGMEDTFADVMVGSRVTIRHVHTQGGYLHSHPSTYPGGSKQQQITLYPHRDDNNVWLVLNATADTAAIPDPEHHAPPAPVPDHTTLVFHHPSTHKKLHSHDIRAPITEVDYQNEVSGYGFEGFEGDANDHWVLEIDQAESDGRVAKKQLETLRTKFRLRHLLTGCYLFSHKVKLPDWGFEQQEVTCNKNPSRENALWYVETNTHPMLPADAKKVNYRRPSFLAKFLELQAVMWQTNQGLTDRHAYDSRPHSWPLLLRGINFWVKDHRQIYLIGNPFVWALSTIAVLSYVAIRGLLILRAQRGYKDFANSQVVFYERVATFLFSGWFLHYFPFFLMGRQLFLHHYFPALYFALLLVATSFDLATARLKPRLRLYITGVLVFAAVGAWWYLSPLAYAGRSDYYPHPDAVTTTATSSDGATSLAPAVQPGRAGFEPVEKAPASGVGAPPHLPPVEKLAEAVWDAERDGPLFEHGVEAGDKPKKEEEQMTTSVVLNQPAEAPGAHPEDEGVAIPAAAEGTTALPVKAIVQADEAGGGKAAGPDAEVEAEAEKKVDKTGDHEHEDFEVVEAEAGVDALEHEQEQDVEDLVDEEH
ncbi:Dolichyl-phosphate-mannose--protein mannosyltransferase 1 [Rhodotorula toruloides]